MKLPSINYLISNAITSFNRFPLVILSSFVAVVLSIFQYEYEIKFNDENFILILNLILTFVLGIILFFTTKILIERLNFNKVKTLITHSISILILFLLYQSLPSDDITITKTVPYIRFFIFSLILHLTVSFIPYLKKGDINGFWNFNKALFLRFLTSILFSGVFYIGVTIAISSSNFLFDLDLDSKSYLYLFYVSMGILNTWFFIFGIPKNFEELSSNTSYPRGLKIFTQYILLPLLILYILILYLYIAKVLLDAQWPNGIIPYMVFGVSLLGIFLNLLMYPYRNFSENSWIRKFSRIYYVILIPLIALMFYAIIIRIDEYGITVNRYVILALAVWLSFVSLYFTANGKNIKIIPKSLALLLLLISFGPWSIFNISEHSQINRLEKILTDAEILKDGKIQNEVIWKFDSVETYRTYKDTLFLENDKIQITKKTDTIFKYTYSSDNEETNEENLNDSLHNEVYSILKYLDEFHGYQNIKHWYSQNLDSLITNAYLNKTKWNDYYQYSNFSLFIKSIGISASKKIADFFPNSFYYNQKTNYFVNLPNNYDILIQNIDKHNINSNTNKIQALTNNLNIKLHLTGEDIPELTLEMENIKHNLNFKDFINSLLIKYGKETTNLIPKEKLLINYNHEQINILFDIERLSFDIENDNISLRDFKLNIFLKLNQKTK